ncbi:glycosyltransferase family 2 protein [Vagococcus carniphilus]|uniref:glycosyltransferase family 2 protein n=1 Tax=Vagococcus carniphilus TaxID=218144 RepID=UPI003B5BFF39
MIASIAIVARNEEGYIEKIFNDILNQTYPLNQIELLLIDSMSTDKTLDIMKSIRENNLPFFYRIKIIQNVEITQASGWNKAIKHFSGETLTRIDAHSSIEFDFIENVINSIKAGEYVVGGPRLSIIENENVWSNLLYVSETSMFGSGIASYRQETDQNSYKKTMFHATYKREVLEKVGFFNENLGRTEDNDFHYRIREKGYKLFYTNKIKSYQYIRPTLRKMISQKYGNGYWIGRTLFVQPKCLSIFHFVPFLFLVALIISIITLLLFDSIILLFLVLGSYLIFCLVSMFINIIRQKKMRFLLLPIIFFILHISYGLGTVNGLLIALKGEFTNFIRR